MAFYSSDPATTSGETVYDVTPESDSGSSDDPATTSTSSSSSTSTSTQTGGEHTYDVDDSVDDDPALDYSSINDPRQTEEDTTGTAGGEVESDPVPTGWDGGIGGGLGGEEQDGSIFPTGYGGTEMDDDQKEQTGAVSDATHDDDGDHTTDSIPDDPRYIVFDDGDPETDSGGVTEPDWDGDGEPGGNATERIPDIELPDVPSPELDVEVGGGWKVAAAVAIGAGVLYSQASSSGGGS